MKGLPVLIDGGFSTQLSQHIPGTLDDHPLWVARFLVLDKASCIAVHKDFVKTGSSIIRTNTYQLSKEGFMEHMKMTEDQVIDLVHESVNFCKKAILEVNPGRNVQIAGSIGPYGACLHDGSEYSGSYADSVATQVLKDWHRFRIENLIKAGVDLLAVETIPCSKEALAILDLLKEFPNVKAWISFSIKSESQISDGENFAKVAKKCWDNSNGQVIAVGVNCCNPRFVLPLIKSLLEIDKNIPFIAYPNSGETFDGVNKEWIVGSNLGRVVNYVPEWLEVGIAYVGTCCRNTVEDLAAISQVLEKYKNAEKS